MSNANKKGMVSHSDPMKTFTDADYFRHSLTFNHIWLMTFFKEYSSDLLMNVSFTDLIAHICEL